jgi:hypothetical protein
MLFASIWGHWIAQAHVAGRSILPATLISVAIAASLHGLYDFIVILNPRHSLPVAALGIIVIWLWRLRVLRTMHRNATKEDR